MSACPVGCGRTVSTGRLMCRTCWAEVPKDLQRKVNSTWRKWSNDMGSVEAMAAYKEARDDAIGSVS